MSTIVTKLYDADGMSSDALLEVESNDYEEVDIVLSPRTEDASTITLTVEEAWRLSRELAKVAAGVELNREARMPAP